MYTTKIVRFVRPPTEADLAALRAIGAEIVSVSALLPEATVRLPEAEEGEVRATAAAIQALDQVAAVEDDFDVHTALVDVAPLVQVAALWALPPRVASMGLAVLADPEPSAGQGVVVGILDTGLDLAYPDFRDRVASAKDYTGENDPQDRHGHGTHVAGIIGQDGRADARYVGMAPRVRYRIYRVLRANGSGQATWIARALEAALADGCHVLNLSLGGEAPSPTTDVLERTVDAVTARGLIVCVASGNAGAATPFRQTPARAQHAITVGASTKADGIASFTSRGLTDDGRIKPNVYAPGEHIGAARSSTGSMGTAITPWITRASGTSMATPAIAGLVACLLTVEPSLRGQPSVVKALLMDASRGRDIGAEGPRVAAPALARRPYPGPETGIDRRPAPPAPPAEPPSDCEPLIAAALEELGPEGRRVFIRRVVPALRREFRRALANQ